jgi:hypothetical protein
MRDIKLVPIWKASKHISHIAIDVRCCSIFRVDSTPNEVVHDVVETLESTPPAICYVRIPPHVAIITNLRTILIMNTGVSPVHPPKTKNPTEGNKVNVIVATINHPM